ncbi:helix-turn-helix domain-containing protein [Bradyrhizobium genosp. L]|uniref:helix-turn-helix domain-containing protein n=1 Tax=Bradyrhizobium genosp. L TaxID=83637 RepID=UPI0018A2D200|nr:helix-turn-helix domain-containing protein [Bradyrhizobium genosp. L]QPF87002.1 helix-turn-helix domain-containing protein [Bradyrhizobium genosp. L]
MTVFVSPDQRTIADQRVRIEELEEELRQLKSRIAPPVTFPGAWNLYPSQHRLLAAFSASRDGFLSSDQIYIALGSEAEYADNLIKAQICHLRRKVDRLGIKIVCRKELGYEMTPDSVAFVRSVLRARSQAT